MIFKFAYNKHRVNKKKERSCPDQPADLQGRDRSRFRENLNVLHL